MLVEIGRKKVEPSAFPQFLEASKGCRRDGNRARMKAVMEENEKLRRERVELKMQIAYFKDVEMRLMESLSHCNNNTLPSLPLKLSTL